jgi:hypothetical protein
MVPLSVTREDPEVALLQLVGEHHAFSSSRLENELAVLLDDGLRLVVDPTIERATAAVREGVTGADRLHRHFAA